MKFELQGYNVDNLLKTLYNKKITLKNVERMAYDKVSFVVNEGENKKVKRYIKNFKISTKKVGIKKLPGFLLANVGIIVGVFVGIIVSIYLSCFTWQIEIYGTKDLTKQDVLNVLTENNIKKGKINTTTSEEIEQILLNKYNRIAQVSVIKQGTAIIINLSEKLVYVEQDYKPITACYSGIVTSINVITGTLNCKVGDYVNVGDSLVLPFNINSNGEKVKVNPIAEIYGKIFVVGRAELNKKETVYVKSGKQNKVYTYKLFNQKIFSGKKKNSFAIFDEVVYNENVSNVVPLTREVHMFCELVPNQIEHNFETELENVKQQSQNEAYKHLPIGKIEAEKISTSVVGEKLVACTVVEVTGLLNVTN